MMLHPTIDELTQGKFNRYELALATAKCARLITDEYVRQHDVAERSQTGNKETDRPVNSMIDRELRDEKAVKVAIGRIYAGDFVIDENVTEPEESVAPEADGTEEADALTEQDGETLADGADESEEESEQPDAE